MIMSIFNGHMNSLNWLIFLIMPYTAFGQMNSITIKKITDFEVNGKGDNPAWQATDFVTIPQRSNDEVSYRTKVKVLYSDIGIYFFFECEDREIISTITEDNGDLWEEDVVEVFFWTDEDYPFYFEYELSPRNYELPIIVPNVEGKFHGWLPWHYTGQKRTRHATHIVEGPDGVTAWLAEFLVRTRKVMMISRRLIVASR